MGSWGVRMSGFNHKNDEVIDLTGDSDPKEVVVIDSSSDDDGPKNHQLNLQTHEGLHSGNARPYKKTHLQHGPANIVAGETKRNIIGSESRTARSEIPFVTQYASEASISAPRIVTDTDTGNGWCSNRPDNKRLEAYSRAEFSAASIDQQTKPKLAETQQSRLRLPVKPFRIYCTECTEAGLECDGERPCSRCIEPGLECNYPGDPSPSPEPPKISATASSPVTIMKSTLSQRGRSKSAASSTSASSDLGSYGSDVPLTKRSKLVRIEMPTNNPHTKPPPAEVQTQFPTSEWIPSTAAEVTDLVLTMRQNLDMQQEYWLQNALLQSANRARQTPLHPSKTPTENPFRRLVSGAKFSVSTQFERKVVTVYKGSTTSNASKKSTSFIPTELGWDDQQQVLPPYKSIGRMGSAFLAKNVHTIKFLPYFSDDEEEANRLKREKWLRKRYRNNGLVQLDEIVKELVEQRACLERLHRWSKSFLDILDVLKLRLEIVAVWACENLKRFAVCHKCNLGFVKPKGLLNQNQLSTEDRVKCDWLREAFKEVTSIAVWHFVEERHSSKADQMALSEQEQRKADSKSSICVICCVPNCTMHGLNIDGGTDENEHQGPLINDPEVENNKRKLLVLKTQEQMADHLCGLYCTAGLTEMVSYSDLFGLDDTGILSGIRNVGIEPLESHLGFDDLQACDRDCFIVRSNRNGVADLSGKPARTYLQEALSTQQIAYLETHTKLFKSSVRLPCSLARRLKITCSNAFKYLVMLHRSTASLSKHRRLRLTAQGPKKGYVVKPDEYGRRILKIPFSPCSHEGPCKKEHGCPCATREAHCEHSCGCDGSCLRRFPGCNCNGPCFDNTKCLCFKYGRECDPWVCKSCGVVEVLDPSNKYNEEIRLGRCINNRMQLALPARTVKGSSQVQGWGLFAGEDMPKSTYVGEYKGEIVTTGDKHEAERRGFSYHQGGLEFLFEINTEQEIDGSRFGNKTRFINHTNDEKIVNLRSMSQFVNGVTRVAFWTARNIKAGEEFFYDYNYQESVTKNFWTLHREQDLDDLLPIPKPVITETGTRRANQTAFDSDEEDEESDEDEDTESSGFSSPEISSPAKNQAKKNLKRKMTDGPSEPPILDLPPSQPPGSRRIIKFQTSTTKSASRQPSERREASPARHAVMKAIPRGKSLNNAYDDDESDDDYEDEDQVSVGSESGPEDINSDDEVLSRPSTEPKKKSKPRLIEKIDKRKGGEAQRKAHETRRKNREKLGK